MISEKANELVSAYGEACKAFAWFRPHSLRDMVRAEKRTGGFHRRHRSRECGCDQLASRDALIERLIEAGNKLAEWIADEWMFTDNKVHNRDWHKWKDLIAEIRAGKGEG